MQNQCVICLEENGLTRSLECNCIFYMHESCVEEWKKGDQACPICRSLHVIVSASNHVRPTEPVPQLTRTEYTECGKRLLSLACVVVVIAIIFITVALVRLSK
jgi:hypothetical protein